MFEQGFRGLGWRNQGFILEKVKVELLNPKYMGGGVLGMHVSSGRLRLSYW